MKVQLAVMSPSRWEGKSIPIPFTPFLIGRDPECHLRPSSPAIGPRQCAVVIRAGKVFLRPLGMPAGTLINGQEVQGEQELHTDDRLEVGPLAFVVRIEGGPVARQPSAPEAPATAAADEEAAAALLLGPAGPDNATPEAGPAPETAPPQAETRPQVAGTWPAGRQQPIQAADADTATAAGELLARYRTKPRRRAEYRIKQ